MYIIYYITLHYIILHYIIWDPGSGHSYSLIIAQLFNIMDECIIFWSEHHLLLLLWLLFLRQATECLGPPGSVEGPFPSSICRFSVSACPHLWTQSLSMGWGVSSLSPKASSLSGYHRCPWDTSTWESRQHPQSPPTSLLLTLPLPFLPLPSLSHGGTLSCTRDPVQGTSALLLQIFLFSSMMSWLCHHRALIALASAPSSLLLHIWYFSFHTKHVPPPASQLCLEYAFSVPFPLKPSQMLSNGLGAPLLHSQHRSLFMEGIDFKN